MGLVTFSVLKQKGPCTTAFAMVNMSANEFLFKTEGSNALLCSLAEGPCKTNIMSKLYKSKHHRSYRASAMYKNLYPHWYFLMILTWRRLGGASVMTAEHALRKTSGSRITCKTQYIVKLGIRPLLCCDVQDKLHVAPQDKTAALRTAKTLLPMVLFSIWRDSPDMDDDIHGACRRRQLSRQVFQNQLLRPDFVP